MRFNSEERLLQWQRNKPPMFPNIHIPLGMFVLTECGGQDGIDLCCSTGLLGTQLISRGFNMVGIDSDLQAIDLAVKYGVPMPITHAKIDQQYLPNLIPMFRGADFMVARRCFSEVFGYNPGFGPEFMGAMAENGVRELFLEGRARVKNPTHPMPSLDEEIAVAESHYYVTIRRGEMAKMVVKE